MTVNVKLLLTGHPLLFHGRKRRIERLHSVDVLTAIRGCGRDIHPLLALKRIRNKLANQKRRGIITIDNKAHVLLFAAYKSSADVVAGISEVDVYVISHAARNIKGMLNEQFSQFLPLKFRVLLQDLNGN